MRIDDLAAVADEDMMHAYPLYCRTARSFLDPELVPFSCALTAGLSGTGRRTLMQEFGLCTAPPGSAGSSIIDDFLGDPRPQYLASEEEAAAYYRSVMGRLVDTGAAGAYAWCYGDYDARLFGRPPFATAVRERTFGLVRADGREKPAAGVFREFRKRREAGELVVDASHRCSTSALTSTIVRRACTSIGFTRSGSRRDCASRTSLDQPADSSVSDRLRSRKWHLQSRRRCRSCQRPRGAARQGLRGGHPAVVPGAGDLVGRSPHRRDPGPPGCRARGALRGMGRRRCPRDIPGG